MQGKCPRLTMSNPPGTLPDRSTSKLSLLSVTLSSVDLIVTSLLGIRDCWSRDCLLGPPFESQAAAGYQIIRATLWFGLSFVAHERSIMVTCEYLWSDEAVIQYNVRVYKQTLNDICGLLRSSVITSQPFWVFTIKLFDHEATLEGIQFCELPIFRRQARQWTEPLVTSLMQQNTSIQDSLSRSNDVFYLLLLCGKQCIAWLLPGAPLWSLWPETPLRYCRSVGLVDLRA